MNMQFRSQYITKYTMHLNFVFCLNQYDTCTQQTRIYVILMYGVVA